MFGFTQQDVFGKTSLELNMYLNPEERMKSVTQVNKDGFGRNLETKLRTKSGVVRDFTITTNTIDINNIKHVLTTADDITERKKAEEALRGSEINLEKAQRIANMGSWDWDLISNTSKWSKEMFRILDIDPDQYDARPDYLMNVIHPDDVELVTNSMDSNYSSGQTRSIEYRVIHKDGSIHELIAEGQLEYDEAGNPIRNIGIIQDITERKQVSEKLRESEEKYRLIVENAHDGIEISQDDKLIYSNTRFAEMLGYSVEELAGKTFKSIFTDQAKLDLKERTRIRNSTGIKTDTYETTFQQKSGNIIDVEVNYEIIDYNGKPATFSIIRDITERFLLQKELEKSRDRLRLLSQQLISVREEERTNLALELHDGIGQVLTALNFDLDRIQSNLTPDQTQIGVKIEDMTRLLRSTIVDVQRISGELRPRLLDELGLDDAILWYANDFSDRTTIEVEYINKMAIRKVDAPRSIALFRIMQEALTNVARHAEASKVMIRLSDTSGGVLMKIADDGIGIQIEDKHRINSIGLVGMKERTLPFGGTFSIEVRKGGGTLITVTLPDILE